MKREVSDHVSPITFVPKPLETQDDKTAMSTSSRQFDAGSTWVVAAVWGMLLAVLLVMGLATWLAQPQPTPSPPVSTATPNLTPTSLPVNQPPKQTARSNAPPITLTYPTHTWELRPRASYQISGRVISRQSYTSDWMADISPLDLAIGWGELSSDYLDFFIRWQQRDRFLYYTWSGDLPITPDHLNSHVANTHIIPASDSLRQALSQLSPNDHIYLEGLLVDIAKHEPGQPIPQSLLTSLVRTDIGDGSCEILYVQRLIAAGREYR